MKTQNLVILALVAGGLGLAAWVVSSKKAPSVEAPKEPVPLFPDLKGRVNDVASVEVRRGKDAIRVVRTGEGANARWSIESKGGFPADVNKVREVVVGMVNVVAKDERSSDPKNYARLGVQDPSDTTTDSTFVALADGAGKGVASLIVGKPASSGLSDPFAAPMGGSGTFVRRGGDKPAFLAERIPNLETFIGAWATTDLTRVDATRVTSVTLKHPGTAEKPGEVLQVSKGTQPNQFVLENVPTGREVSNPGTLSGIAGALGFLNFEDVTPAGKVFTEGAADVYTLEYKTNDGLAMLVRLRDQDGKSWITLKPTHEPLPVPEPAPTPTPLLEGQTDPSAQAKATNERVGKEVGDLAKLAEGWAFAIPSFTATTMKTSMQSVLKALPVPPAAPGATAPAALPEQPTTSLSPQ